MFKAAFFCMGLALAACPLIASAQDTPGPAPTAAPPEHFIMVDGAVTGKTSNEIASKSTSGFGVRAAAEVPVIGHNWMAQVDFRSYDYQHGANGGIPNGLTFGCPAGDQGCVTPIGYNVYNTEFYPGPSNYLNAMNAQDTTTQIGFGSKIAPIERFYISVGYVIRGANYLNTPTTSGMGFGLDKLPDVDRMVSIYGNFWLFFNVNGNYTGPASPALGNLSSYPLNEAYRMFSYRLGATVHIPKTPLFVDISDVGDREDVIANAPSGAEHNMLFLGVGTKF